MDVFTKEKRSKVMGHIRGKDTKYEVLVRKYLYHQGVRYRKNYNKIPGEPDIAVTSRKTAIFIHGCFWHQHENCKFATMPSTNIEYWQAKFLRNRSRDVKVCAGLESMGWKVIILWECELKKGFENEMSRVLQIIS